MRCGVRLTPEHPDTEEWLRLDSRIDHSTPDYHLFRAVLDADKEVVVKVGPNVLEKEYRIGSLLETLNLPTFLPYICTFQCMDHPKRLRAEPMPTTLCSAEGNEMHILVMPSLNGKTINNIKWSADTFDVFKNVLLHVTASLFVAVNVYGFIHRDLHVGNVMLMSSRRKEISYGEYGTIPCMGYVPVIFDYDQSEIKSKKHYEIYKTDIQRYILSAMSESNIKFGLDRLLQEISDLMFEKPEPSPEVYARIVSRILSMKLISV